MSHALGRMASRLGAAGMVMIAGQAWGAAASRQPAAAPPPVGPQASVAFQIDLGEWKDGYPPQVLASLRAANAEQFVLPPPGYVAPALHQLSLPPQMPFGVATQIYDGGDGVVIKVTPYADGAVAVPTGPMFLDYEITVDGVSLRKGRLTVAGGKAGAYTDGYQKVPTRTAPGQVIALWGFVPSTVRAPAGATLPGMGAYGVSASQNRAGRRDGDNPDGPTTCSFHVAMPSDDYVETRKARGETVVRLKADRSGFEALGGMTLPPAFASLPIPARPAGGWCDEAR